MLRLLASAWRRCAFILLTACLLIPRTSSADSILLDGVDDYLSVPTDSPFSLSQFTVEAWFRREAGGVASTVSGTSVYPMVSRGYSENFGLAIQADGKLCGIMWTTASTRIFARSPAAIPIGEWHHGAVTFDGTDLKLYLDGQLVSQAPTGAAAYLGSSGVRIGQMLSSGTGYGKWSGYLDEIRIWNRARTAQEIALHYAEAITMAPDLVARWGFEGVTTGSGLSPQLLGRVGGAAFSSSAPTFAGLAPSVQIVSPASGTDLVFGAPVAINAQATDADLIRLDYYFGTTKVREGSPGPTEFTDLPKGDYVVHVIGVDASGRQSGSTVTFRVIPPTGTDGLYFNGTSGFARTSIFTTQPLGQFTVEAGFRVEGVGSPHLLNTSIGSIVGLVHRGSLPTSSIFLGFRPSDNRLVACLSNVTDTAWLVGNTPVPRNTWQHAAVTFDGQFIRLALNGTLDAQSRTTIVPNDLANSYTRFGDLQVTEGERGFFHGSIDDVLVWNYARPLAAIAAGRGLNHTGAAGLQNFWRLNEGSGSALADAGARGWTATAMTSWAWTDGFPDFTGTIPTVSLAPSGPQTLPRGLTLALTASASDPDGIARVELWDDTGKVAETATAPYAFNWPAQRTGPFRLTAIAFDSLGHSGASAPVSVNVTAEGGPGALVFDGLNGKASIDSTTQTLDQFTVEAWFRRDQVGAGLAYDGVTPVETLVIRQYSTYTTQYANFILGINSTTGCVVGGFGGTAIKLLTGTTPSPYNVWRHVALSYDGAIARLYVDGQLEAEGNLGVPNTASGQTLTFGRNTSSTPLGTFAGALDEVRIWRYPRTAPEILGARMQAIATAPGLVSRWTFNEGTGTTATSTGEATYALTLALGTSWGSGTVPSSEAAPVISFTSPANGSTAPILSPLAINCAVSDADSAVAKVELYVGNTKLDEDTQAPFTFSYQTDQFSSVRFRAVAIDATGLTGSTDFLDVTFGAPSSAGSLFFNGTSSYVEISPTASFAKSQFTVEAWIRPELNATAFTISTIGPVVPIISRGSTSDGFNFLLAYSGGRLQSILTRSDTGIARAQSSALLQFGAWQHVATTYDGNFLRVYVNGVLEGESAAFVGPVATPTQRLAFGTTISPSNTRSGYYRGFIGNARIWDVARPGPAILADLKATAFAPPLPLAAWSFNEPEPQPIASTGSATAVSANMIAIQRSIPEPGATGVVPQVTLSANASSVVEGQSVTFTAAPTVATGVITRVEFFNDATKVGEATGAPWSFTCAAATPGFLRVTAVATADSGEQAASNTVTIPIAPAIGQGGLYFDGVDDDVILPPSNVLSAKSGTIECWFRRDGTGSVIEGNSPWLPLVSRGRLSANNEMREYLLAIAADTGKLIGAVGNAQMSSSAAIPTGEWHHAALTWDSTATRLYLDGVQVSTSFGLSNLPPAASAPAIGTATTADGQAWGHFQGAIDEVRIWSEARPATDIANSRSQAIRAAANLSGRWGFDEAAGPMTADSSGNGVAGKLRGNPTRIAGAPLTALPIPAVALVSPAPGASISPATAVLQAQITTEAPTALTYRFRGRSVARDAGTFTVVAIPDSVNYTHARNGGSPAILDAIMDWAVANRASRNIAFVTHTGNLVDAAAADASSAWTNASGSFGRLENPATTGLADGIPFGIAPGALDLAATNLGFRTNFGRSRFAGRGWFASSSPIATNANSLQLFTAGGVDFAVAHIAYDSSMTSSSAAIVWLGSALAQYPERRFIIVTPELLAADVAQTFIGNGTVFSSFLATKSNVAAVIGGRALGEARRAITTTGGMVPVLTANFSGRPQGGGGWIRLLEFSPARGTIRSRAYSPTQDQFESDEDSDFTVAWPTPAPAPAWADVSPSSPVTTPAVSTAWSGLLPGRRYEWTAEASNGVDQVNALPRALATTIDTQAQPPTVALLEPATPATATLPAAIYLQASASSPDDAVERVEFFVDETCVFTDTAAPYAFIWQPGNTGAFQITARATDRRGLQTVSAPVACTIAPETATSTPTISLANPGGTTVHFGTPTLDLVATASVPSPNAIASVSFFVNDAPVATDTASPYTTPVSFTAPGTYDLRAIATTTEGGSAASAIVRITILPVSSLNLTRGPYLQMASPTSMMVRWRTGTNTRGRVMYGTSPDALTAYIEEPTAKTDHEVQLTGLQPNTRYYYAVGVNGGAANNGSDQDTEFLTPPLSGRARNTRIWALGDSGTGLSGQKATRDAYYNFTGARGTDVLLLLGDNAYNSATDAEYQANHFDIYAPLLKGTPTWATLGNHETDGYSLDSTFTYLAVFNHPKAAELGGAPSGTERYYSFDYGNVHFISLDSMYSSRAANGAMATWLQADLAATTARWIIAFWHHPPYSKGGWDSDTETAQIQMRQVFNPILEQNGVDLVLGGHSHNYERSYFMSGHFGLSSTFSAATMRKQDGLGRPGIDGAYLKDTRVSAANKGTVYVVAGSAASLYSASLNHPAMAVSRNQMGTAVVDVAGNQLSVKFVRDNGTVGDYFTMIKPWGTADSDGDGLPNDYESEYGLNPAVNDSAADSDSDGTTNGDEYLAGTDPNDPNSRLTVTIGGGNGSPTSLGFPSVAGRTYTVERRGDLLAGNWETIRDAIAGTGDIITIDDPNPLPGGGFYRLKVR